MTKNAAKIIWQFSLMFAISFFSLWNYSLYAQEKGDTSLRKIETIVVIYAENRSFDNLYGMFPCANGIFKTGNGIPTDFKDFKQVDRDGVTPLANLPSVWNSSPSTRDNDASVVKRIPNEPFRIDAPSEAFPGGLMPDKATPDLTHRFYNNQMQINDGKNNMFAAWSDAGGLTMGYYDGSVMRLWKLAKKYTLADNFFMGAFGGSFLNHFW
ncbi:MAG: alkaline phosphatase family protein, partial [Chlorobiaceae bacterium]